MHPLVIPQAGLPLETSHRAPSKPGVAVQDAFALTLNDNIIEEMIKCFQNGKPIQLSLGEQPILEYGSKSQKLSISTDNSHHELFRSSTSSSTSTSEDSSDEDDDDDMSQPPNKHFLPPHKRGEIRFQNNKPNMAFLSMFGKAGLKAANNMHKAATKAAAQSSLQNSSTTGVDDALASLQGSLASEQAKKDAKTIIYDKTGPLGTPARGKAAPQSKFPNRLGNNSSRGASPFGSPALGPTSIPLSQQQAEKAKEIRRPIIHMLAAYPMEEQEILNETVDWSISEVTTALRKVGDLNESTKKWELRKNYFKELDVWEFDYRDQRDRTDAINNAIKVYDRMRLAISEPEWERLLCKEERGTGKVLSKLQKNIAEGIARGPKINVSKAEESGRETPLEEGATSSRAGSQPPKVKKPSEKEQQMKRLLGKPSTAKNASANKTSTPKTAPTPKVPAAKKEKMAPALKSTGKQLSSQFVSSSDDDDDLLATPAPPKQAPKSLKRSREEENVDTSDSSVPLSKKVKAQAPISRPKTSAHGGDKPKHENQRVSDASQSSRATNSAFNSQSSQRSKGTSPQKSSPLASSPPTNASEFDNSSSNSSGRVSPVQSVRKVSQSPIHKRHQKSSSVTSSTSSTSSQRSLKPSVVDLARKYRSFYPKYALLHKEVANLGRRDRELEQKLLDMHERLTEMKAKIMQGVVEIQV